MKMMILGLSLVCAMAFSMVVSAEDAAPATPAPAGACKPCNSSKKIETQMKKADKDNDGKVSVAEYEALYVLEAGKGAEADKNTDGFIEVDEFVIVAPCKEEKKEKKEKKAEKKADTPE